MKKHITIFFIISVLTSCIVLLGGCVEDGDNADTTSQKPKDGIYKIDMINVTAENEAVVAEVNKIDFGEKTFVCLTQDFGENGDERHFIAYMNKNNYSPEFSANFKTTSSKAGIDIHLKKLKGGGSNEIQLYELVISANVDAFHEMVVDGVKDPDWHAVSF